MGYHRFQIGCLLAEFDLFKPTTFIQNCIFDKVVNQFLEIGTSDITFMGRDQELKWLAFSPYPLSFFLYSPFKFSFTRVSFCLRMHCSREKEKCEVCTCIIAQEFRAIYQGTETKYMWSDDKKNSSRKIFIVHFLKLKLLWRLVSIDNFVIKCWKYIRDITIWN